MECGDKLITNSGLEFFVKSIHPDGQGGRTEKYYELISPIGSVTLSNTIINYLFSKVINDQFTQEIKEEIKEVTNDGESKGKDNVNVRKGKAK